MDPSNPPPERLAILRIIDERGRVTRRDLRTIFEDRKPAEVDRDIDWHVARGGATSHGMRIGGLDELVATFKGTERARHAK